MSLKNVIRSIVPITLLFLLPSCGKDPVIPPTIENGKMNIQFSYVFGTDEKPITLDQQVIHAKTGDTLKFSMIRYFVSNIKLKKEDGTWWAMPESYYLADASDPKSETLNIPDIPYGKYTAMEYTMGVDSARNVSGANTGALSLQNGMFWTWNSGYIMTKLEGYSPNSSIGVFALHFGGFKGNENVVTTRSVDFGKALSIGDGATPYTIYMTMNLANTWASSPGVKTTNTLHDPGPVAVTMAKGLYGSIKMTSIK